MMSYRRIPAFLAAAALAVAAVTVNEVRAQEAQSAIEEAADYAHADCSFFGAHRDDYLASGLGAQMLLSERRSALTAAVVAQLSGGPSAPLRSRTGSLAFNKGPIRGESIDDFVFGLLAQKRIAPAPKTTDAEFLRRASIDLTGRIPTATETIAFLQDASADKRSQLVGRLLESSAWVDRWALFLGDQFRNTQATAQVNRFPGGRDALHLFFVEALRSGKSYDAIVREMLAAEGPNDGRPWPVGQGNQSPFSSYNDYLSFLQDEPARADPASYIVGGRTTGGPAHDTYDALAVNVARDLLGVAHMDCVLCHDGAGHLESLNLWGAQAKRAEGWGLAAFFQRVWLTRPPYRVERDSAANAVLPPYYVVQDVPTGRVIRDRRGNLIAGEYSLDTDGGNRPDRVASDNGGVLRVTPKYPFGGGEPASGESYREALGRLVTADRQFARATVNYVWREFFGLGIVDPVDQFDLARLDPSDPPADPWTIQPSHPEMLEFLADGFIESGFDLKHLMRSIVESEAYQLSARYDGAWSPAYEPYLARHMVRRMSAEALLDAVTIATGAPISLPLPNLTQRALGNLQFAMQLPDVQNMPIAARNRPEGELARSFLDAFFRGDREESPRSSEVSILQSLQLMNNPLVVNRIEASAARGLYSSWLGRSNEELVQLLYLQTLARPASADEVGAAVAFLSEGDRRARLEDLAWTLMNKVDFIFNY